MIPIFAVTTRGLEDISAAEMSAFGLHVTGTAYRRVLAEAESLEKLAHLRTVDDVFLLVERWNDVSHTRAELERFTERCITVDLDTPLAAIRHIRELPQDLQFSVTANFVGARNYSTPEIKTHIALGVLDNQLDWMSVDEDQSDINLRLFIDHDEALLGVRLLRSALHQRPYKLHHLPGSLKPPIAAAMLNLAAVEAGMTLLDPFCGVGTIVVEAGSEGVIALGSDIDPEVIPQAAANSRAAHFQQLFFQGDAARLPLANASIDRIISNLPWGRQVVVDENLASLYERAFAEMLRVVRPGGSITLLTTLPHLIEQTPTHSREISLFGQNPYILHFAK